MIQHPVSEELIRMAIFIEGNGASMYQQMASRSKDPEVIDKLRYLAQQEKRHEDIFGDMLVRFNHHSFPIPEQRFQYLKDLADVSIFDRKKVAAALSEGVRTDIEAVEIGIRFEKDSLLFYSEMNGMFPRAEQHIVDAVINEERKHLSELAFIKNQIMACHSKVSE